MLTSPTVSGSDFYYGSQTQGTGSPDAGECQLIASGYPVDYPRCAFVHDVFIDNVPLTQAASVAALAPGKFFFDYAADRIYIRDNPAGKTVETSLAQCFLHPSLGVNNLTVKNLVIEKFAVPAQVGAIDSRNSTGWTVTRCTFRFNHGLAVYIGSGFTATFNVITRNGQMGIGGAFATGVTVTDNEISYNNYAKYSPGWEAGGTKFALCTTVLLARNWVRHNDGPGLWCDGSNRGVVYEYNVVENNTGNGIFHEIGYAAVIRYNRVVDNGTLTANPWTSAAQILISCSPDVQVYGNIVSSGSMGIVGIQQDRADEGTGYPAEPTILVNLHVYDNTITQTAGWAGGILDDTGSTDIWTGAGNNRWTRNTYTITGTSASSRFLWLNAERSWTYWQGTAAKDTAAAGGSAVFV